MSDLQTELAAAEAKAKAARGRGEDERSRARGDDSRDRDDSIRLDRPGLDHWAPPSLLSAPPADREYAYRWVTEYVNGTYTPQRLNRARREGYQFVQIDDLPEGFYVEDDMKGDGLARTGGMILARIPVKFAEQRKAYYAKRRGDAIRGANELQGIAGSNAVEENRGTRSLDGREAGVALRSMAQTSA